MYNQARNAPLRVFDKRNLHVSRFKKEVGFWLGEHLDFRLCVQLRHQLFVFITNRDGSGRKLNCILPDIFLQNRRCYGDSFTFPQYFIRCAKNDSWQVIGNSPRWAIFIVTQNDDCNALWGKTGDVGYETRTSAAVRDFLTVKSTGWLLLLLIQVWG